MQVNQIYNEDCIDERGMCLIPDKSIDLILCDLPYGTTQCSWDAIIPFDALWAQYRRIIKNNGTIVLTASQPFTSILITSNLPMFKYTWVWEKSKATGFLNAKRRPLVAHEDIVVFAKKTPRYFPQMTEGEAYNKGIRKQQTENDVYGSFDQVEVKSDGERCPRSVQYFKTAESEGKVIHKSQKPLALFRYLIRTYTSEGDTVLDNASGSGTTALACLIERRNYICFEKDTDIWKLSVARLQGFHSQKRLF